MRSRPSDNALSSRSAGDAYLVDDVTAGIEGCPAMRRTDSDPDGAIADFELADTMHAVRMNDRESFQRFGDDGLAFDTRDRGMGLVLERVDRFAFVQVSDPAFERDAGTRTVRLELSLQRARIDRIRCDRETRCHGSAAGNRREEQYFVAVVQPDFPACQRTVDCDLAPVVLVGEAMPAGHFIVKFGCRPGGRLQRFCFAAGTFAEHRKVLRGDRNRHFDSSL
jgi:hypothetical protein